MEQAFTPATAPAWSTTAASRHWIDRADQIAAQVFTAERARPAAAGRPGGPFGAWTAVPPDPSRIDGDPTAHDLVRRDGVVADCVTAWHDLCRQAAASTAPCARERHSPTQLAPAIAAGGAYGRRGRLWLAGDGPSADREGWLAPLIDALGRLVVTSRARNLRVDARRVALVASVPTCVLACRSLDEVATVHAAALHAHPADDAMLRCLAHPGVGPYWRPAGVAVGSAPQFARSASCWAPSPPMRASMAWHGWDPRLVWLNDSGARYFAAMRLIAAREHLAVEACGDVEVHRLDSQGVQACDGAARIVVLGRRPEASARLLQQVRAAGAPHAVFELPPPHGDRFALAVDRGFGRLDEIASAAGADVTDLVEIWRALVARQDGSPPSCAVEAAC